MSYTPTNWATGDTITAEKLNKLEQGVANAGDGGVFVVTMTGVNDAETGEVNWEANKTCLEIIEALEQGKNVYAVVDNGAFKNYYFLTGAYHEPDFRTTIFFSETEFGYDYDAEKYKLDMKGFKMSWSSGGTDSVEFQEYYYPES